MRPCNMTRLPLPMRSACFQPPFWESANTRRSELREKPTPKSFAALLARSLPACVFLRKVKENMSEKTEAMDQPVKFSRKNPETGLRNFGDATECRRCEAHLFPP